MASPTPPFRVKVSSRFGAPMGRGTTLPKETTEKLYLQRVPFVDGDYDPGGAYWGGGQPLWCAWDSEGDYVFVRAGSSRESAKKEVLDYAPGAKFFR